MKKLTNSLEDYLETIFNILKHEKAAKASEISDSMGVNRTSVTGAMRELKSRGLINYRPYGKITLTEMGKQAATGIARKHELLKEFMTKILLVPESEAEDNACRMEHSISSEVLERFVDFMEFMDACPRIGTDWKEVFTRYRETRVPCTQCDTCVAKIRAEFARREELRAATDKMNFTLTKLQAGQSAIVLDIDGEEELLKRLLDMGIIPGAPIEIEKVAPLGDPISVRVRGFHLTLRKEEAEKIIIELR